MRQSHLCEFVLVYVYVHVLFEYYFSSSKFHIAHFLYTSKIFRQLCITSNICMGIFKTAIFEIKWLILVFVPCVAGFFLPFPFVLLPKLCDDRRRIDFTIIDYQINL